VIATTVIIASVTVNAADRREDHVRSGSRKTPVKSCLDVGASAGRFQRIGPPKQKPPSPPRTSEVRTPDARIAAARRQRMHSATTLIQICYCAGDRPWITCFVWFIQYPRGRQLSDARPHAVGSKHHGQYCDR